MTCGMNEFVFVRRLRENATEQRLSLLLKSMQQYDAGSIEWTLQMGADIKTKGPAAHAYENLQFSPLNCSRMFLIQFCRFRLWNTLIQAFGLFAAV